MTCKYSWQNHSIHPSDKYHNRAINHNPAVSKRNSGITHFRAFVLYKRLNTICLFQLSINLKRCQSKEALDSCETYQTININRLCDLLDPNDKKPWSPLLKTVKPPYSCPIKKVRAEINV